ncbi:hypothetical protein GPUN_2559 [Glaciecola punicea ACAM 611]|uniref:Uncharacterized protein n=1 Tax=Glaciecola punicea ACAM 611 TaxID=1121923 RepID=H5TEE7_9ALTE|nr:hypothetical protein GPUN_2559 [Glaciecola punicea ACAM 611]
MVNCIFAGLWEGIVKHIVSPDTGLSSKHASFSFCWIRLGM